MDKTGEGSVLFTGFGWPIRSYFQIPEVPEIHSFVQDTLTACQTLYPSKNQKRGSFREKNRRKDCTAYVADTFRIFNCRRNCN